MTDSFRMAVDSLVSHFEVSEFARVKPASGQKGFDFDEDSHPRESAAHDNKRPGEFAPKGHIDTEATEEPATARKWYGMNNRPPAPGAIPKGDWTHQSHPDFRHGKISYDRPLTEQEQHDYELTPIHEDTDIPEIAKKAGAAMGEYASQYADPENEDLLNDVLGQSRMRPLLGHVDKDKLKAEIRKQFGSNAESQSKGDKSADPEFNDMVRAAAGYQLHGMRNEPTDPKEWREHSKHMTKSAIDGWLQNKFGIDSATARGVSNAAGEMNLFTTEGAGTVGGQSVKWTHNSPEPTMDEIGETPWMKKTLSEPEVWHQGDRVRMTGKTSKIAGGTFHEAEILEGYKKGQMVQVRDKGEKDAEIAGKQDEWKDQQAGFANLNKTQANSKIDKRADKVREAVESVKSGGMPGTDSASLMQSISGGLHPNEIMELAGRFGGNPKTPREAIEHLQNHLDDANKSFVEESYAKTPSGLGLKSSNPISADNRIKSAASKLVDMDSAPSSKKNAAEKARLESELESAKSEKNINLNSDRASGAKTDPLAAYPSLAGHVSPRNETAYSSETKADGDLHDLAKQSKTVDEFIGHIKSKDLLSKVYDWEQSSPGNIKKHKNSGWFGIASDLWKQTRNPDPKPEQIQPESHGGLIEHLKSIGVGQGQIDAVTKSMANKNGVAIINNGKVSFVDAFNPLTGNRNPQEMIDGDLKSKRGQKFAITNGTVKDEADHSKFIDRVLKHGEWDSGNLTKRQSETLESLVKDGKLTKRKGNADEMTADGIPTIYEPVDHEFSRPEGQGKIWSGVSMDAANSTNAAHAASKAAGGEGHRLSSIIHKQVGSSMLAGDPSAKSHRSAANNHELVASEHEKAASIGDSPQKHAVAAELHRQASKTHREAEVSLAPKTFSRPDGACRSMLVAAVHKALNHDGNYTKDSTVEEIPENPSDLDEHVAAVLSELAKHSPEVKQALESYLAC